MDPRKREIEELETEISKLEQQITSECVAIGYHIGALNRPETRSPELAKYLNSIKTLRKSEDDFRGDIARIRATAKRVAELEATIGENEQRIKDLTRERESRWLELGAGSYTLYKKLADRERFQAFFEDILKLDVEIDRLESDLRALEEEEKQRGLFDRLRIAGRKMSLRGSISRIEKQKMKAFAETGAKVADSDFAAHANGDLRTLFDFAAEKYREMDALQRETQRLREEAKKLRELLLQHGVEDDAELRTKELEKRIADVRRELDVVYSWMGQLYLDKDLRGELTDVSLSAKYEIVNGMRQSIARKRGQIDRLRAELEIEELQKQEKLLRQRRKQLEDELRVRERQISVIDLELETGERRIQSLKKVISGEASYTDAPPLPPTPDFYAKRPPPPAPPRP